LKLYFFWIKFASIVPDKFDKQQDHSLKSRYS
jgi:hypothetical protein